MTVASLPLPLALPSDQDATGRTLGAEEIAAVTAALGTGTLTSTKGAFVRSLESRFAQTINSRFAYACTSGTAAIHIALGALDIAPGDEVITSGITDMGAVAPILYQGAIPVFADVDPHSANLTADTIARVVSDRTKAIIVTHLFGNPCDMAGIVALARSKNIAVIEDCAQAFLATYDGEYVGTLGAIGCFSLQQGKHITTGEGGLVVTNDEELARRTFLLINKAWGYGDPNPDHYFLALNYRMSELQGAVAVAQLEKLHDVVETRIALAEQLGALLEDVPGIGLPAAPERGVHTYWKYVLNVDDHSIAGGTVALGAKLKAAGISSAPRYIQKPAFECAVIRDQRTFGESRWPFTLARPEAVDYRREAFPGTYTALSQVLVLPWNDRYTEDHVRGIAEAIRAACAELAI